MEPTTAMHTPAPLGFYAVIETDRWYWYQVLVRAGHQVQIYTDPGHLRSSIPHAWVLVLPNRLSPTHCQLLREPLTARAVLITPWIGEGVALTRQMRYPTSVAHPDMARQHLPRYLTMLDHLTSGVLVFPSHPAHAGGSR